ncbi:PKD domain-containing protein, partial [Bacteroidota bacterium]
VFHLGTLNGVQVGGGCAYGYFSDYIQNDGAVNIVESGSDIITACYGEEIELEASGGLAYFWSSGTGSDIYLDDVTSDQPSAYLPVGIHTFSVNILGPCGLNVDLPVSVEINDNSESYFTLDEYIGCAPLTVEINNLTLNADTFLWDYEDDRNYDDFGNSGSSTNFYHTYQNQTSSDSIYTLKLFAYDKQDDCPDIYTKTIRVFPEIDADFTLDVDIGCNPLSVNFTDLSSTYTSDDYKWIFGDGESYLTSVSPANVSHEYSHFDITDTVDFEVQLAATSPYFCRDTAIDTISVYSYLEGEFTIDTAFGCSPFTVVFTNNSSGEDSISLDYGDATSIDAATFGNVSHTYTNTGATVLEFPVELEVFNDEGCTKVWRDTVTVYPEIRANYTVDDPGNGSYVGCNTRTVNFANTSNYGANEASSFLWTFGDGANSNTTNVNVPHPYDNTTAGDNIYNFSIHAESVYGCYDDTANQITLYKALANYTIDSDEGCAPLNVNITNTSVGSNIGTWLWDYDDGATDGNENPGTHLHVYNNATGATLLRDLSLTVTHNTQAWCTTNRTEQIDVYSEIDVTYTTNPAAFPICDSVDVAFNSTINPVIAGTLYEWDFGDGTSASIADPTHNYRNQGNANQVTYNVQVDIETPDGCADLATGTVDVNPYVRAFFTIDESSGCSPHSITVTPTNYPGIDEYRWDFDGDATNDIVATNNAQQNFTFPGNYTGADITYDVTLEVADPTGSCTDTYIIPVTVYSETTADFNPQGSIDCNEYTLTFDNVSFNSVDWQWDFDDLTSSSDFEPTHTFINTGAADKTFNVNLAVTSNRGCTHDTTA